VGDPGIEPGVGLPGGVTVRCRTLQLVARGRRRSLRRAGWIPGGPARQQENPGRARPASALAAGQGRAHQERARRRAGRSEKAEMGHREGAGARAAAAETVWLFGLHAVRDALLNPRRAKLRLILTKNAADRLGDADRRRRDRARDRRPAEVPRPDRPGSVHQGAALEVKPLDWGRLEDLAMAAEGRGRRSSCSSTA
jgi:23S rRNA (guanosine2251-2'-O)-methyltransferase